MKDILTGKTEIHLTPGLGGFLFEENTAIALKRLSERAKLNGFDLKIVSSFRAYETQAKIWQAKATGQRDLLDSNGHKLDFTTLNEEQIVEAILRWSAFPGASRHHWGTDIDVYDGSVVDENYQVQLTPKEVSEVFHEFYGWIDSLIAADDCEGFFLPYNTDRGGVAPEAWHLSYRPIAEKNLELYTEEFFMNHLNSINELSLKDIVKSRSAEIYQRYIINIAN